MVTMQAFLGLIQVLLTASIATVPLLYPKHSLYRKKCEIGLKELFQRTKVEEQLEVSSLDAGETGFKKIVDALDSAGYPVPEDTTSIGVAYGDNDKVKGYLNEELDMFVSYNGALFAESRDDTRTPIFYESWGRSKIERLEPVKRSIQRQAERRAHLLTVLLTMVWTLVTAVQVV